MNIYEKLQYIQERLKAPKSQYNEFGKYKYRNCEDILEAIKPLLAEVKAILTISDEIVLIGDRYYVKATARLEDTAFISDYPIAITNTAYAREEETKKGMDGSQITGASSSYARKYALNGLFAIDDTIDSDGTNKHGKEEKKPLDPTLLKQCEELKIKLENVAVYKKKTVEELTDDDLKECIERKQKAKEKKEKEGKQ